MATWSIKSGGGDFVSLQSANDHASVNNGDTLSVDEAMVAQSGDLSLTKQLTVTASGTFGITTPTEDEARAKARVTGAINNSAAGTIVEKLGVILGAFARSNPTADTTFRYQVIVGDGASCRALSLTSAETRTVTMHDCALIAQSADDEFVKVAHANATLNAYQCAGFMPAGITNGIVWSRTAGTANSYGCIGECNLQAWSGTWGGDENLSDDTTAPGTHRWRSFSSFFNDTTSGSEDLSLASGSRGKFGCTDRSGTVAALATDIAGTSRVTAGHIDVGCWQTTGTTKAQTQVQFKHAAAASLAFDSNTTAGNAILVSVNQLDAPPTAPSDGTNTYTLVRVETHGRTNHAVYAAVNIAGGAVTVSSAGANVLQIAEISGVATASAVDDHEGAGGSTNPLTTTLDPTTHGGIYVFWVNTFSGEWTNFTGGLALSTYSSGIAAAAGYRLGAAAGTYTVNCGTGGDTRNAFIVVALKDAGAAAATTHLLTLLGVGG